MIECSLELQLNLTTLLPRYTLWCSRNRMNMHREQKERFGPRLGPYLSAWLEKVVLDANLGKVNRVV